MLRLTRLRILSALVTTSLAGACIAPTPSPPPLILLVTFEGLGADALAEENAAAILPNLTALRAQADWSGCAITSSSVTTPAMASLLTGLAPWVHLALLADDSLRGKFVTLAEALQDHGYKNAAYVSHKSLRPGKGFAQGFDIFEPTGDALAALGEEKTGDGATGREFLWVHLQGSERAAVASSKGQAAPFAAADQELGALLATLKHQDRLASAFLVVTADHGSEPASLAPQALSRSLIEVPLIIKLPRGFSSELKIASGERISQARLFATLIEAVGGSPVPAAAPSLFRSARPGALSVSFMVGGVNSFSFVVDDLQLLRVVRFTSANSQFSGDSNALTQAFTDSLPYGDLEHPASEKLVRWRELGGEVAVSDPALRQRLAVELRRRFLAFSEDAQSPFDAGWRR